MLLQNGMKAPVIFVLAVIFTSCTTTDDIPNTNNGDETSQKWCVYFEEKQCLLATSTTCPGGGLLALACPSDYSGGGGNISSSSRNNFSLSSSSIFISSSSLSVTVVRGSLSDSRDGKSYKTVKIGNQTWMAENLNYNATGSACYNNQDSYCATYGRLYDWATAKTACPSGWYLPSIDEWEVLEYFVGGQRHLKAASGWNNGENGLDTYGFTALPGGGGDDSRGFGRVGERGYWWAVLNSQSKGWSMGGSGGGLSVAGSEVFSLRCIQN